MYRFLVVLAMSAPAALAGQDLVTDRPDQTESALVVPRGAFQLEVGVLTERFEQTLPALDVLTVGTSLLRIGLDQRVEGRIGFGGWQDAGGASGVGDLTLGAKVALTRPDARVTVALLGTGSLTTGGAGIGAERIDPELRVSAATALNERLSVGVNGGAYWTTLGGATRTDALYTAVLGAAVAERVGAFLELFGSLPVSSGGAAAHAMDGGITVLLTPTLQLDASGGVGLNDTAPAWFAGAGMSLRMPR